MTALGGHRSVCAIIPARRSAAARVARALPTLLLLARPALADDAPWARVGEHDGIVVERHEVAGTHLHEVRVSTHSPLPPAAILATRWRQQDFPQFVPYVDRVDVLEDDGDTKLFYEQLSIPLVRDRDVVLRAVRHVDATTGAAEVVTRAVTDAGPPERRDHVRVRTSESRWELAPTADGGSDVRYTIRTDVGGFLPSFVVNAAQRDATPKMVRAILDRAGRGISATP